MNVTLIVSLIAIILSIISIFILVWLNFVFKDLIKISKQKEFSNNTKDIKVIQSEIQNMNLLSKLNVQRIGLTKYNPFNEIGGDHSFSLALLDGNKNGIIITSLHTRERTRLYLKDVFEGKSKIELSKEEEKALKLSLTDAKNN